jgi:excisionase family DNA binding protein
MAAPLHELLNGGNLIRPEELATGLGVAKPTIYLWAKKGVLPCVRLQGCVRFDPGGTDDVANSACGALVLVGGRGRPTPRVRWL